MHLSLLGAAQALRHMLNRHLASAFNAWWEAVLRKREVLARCEQVGRPARHCLKGNKWNTCLSVRHGDLG
jgi:hypothetical protein